MKVSVAGRHCVGGHARAQSLRCCNRRQQRRCAGEAVVRGVPPATHFVVTVGYAGTGGPSSPLRKYMYAPTVAAAA